jgi:tRNA A-37 threonylcarbamoyl transferase component Bud32
MRRVFIQNPQKARNALYNEIADYCKEISGSLQVIAISIFENCWGEPPETRGTIEVIMVVRDFQPRLMSHVKFLMGRNVVTFVVDQWVFERDIERGFLGEASVGTLIFPHTAISGNDYLKKQEIRLKKRLVLELLENLAISFPKLAERILIRPEYFMYEAISSRIRVFPPLASYASNLSKLENACPDTLTSYMEALKELEIDKEIVLSENFVMIPKKFILQRNKHKVRLTNISKNAPRRVFTSAFELFPQILNSLSNTSKYRFSLQKLTLKSKNLENSQMVDPQEYVFIPTSKGLVSLASRIGIEDFARRVLLNNEKGEIVVKPIGGVINDVYLVEAIAHGTKKLALVKRFKDWSGIKWFPLSIWALGARSFAVLGRSRLERECAISELLRKKGFNVPKILHVSHNQRLVFMEYLEGENLSNGLKRIATSKSRDKVEKELEAIAQVGEIIAKVQSLGVALGDTKPENVIIEASGKVYLLDFEQASDSGDKTWDVAEFLYYAGHFLSSLRPNSGAEMVGEAFISGYLKGGGDPLVVRKAGAPKYTRVFSIFTLPSVMLVLSKACRDAGK